MKEAQHSSPVWRERSDFIIAVGIEADGLTTEQLFCRRVAPHQFEVCCIPFFAYDLALGDVVETDPDFLVRRCVQPSGRYVFRVWFGESSCPRDQVADDLSGLGALLEWSSVNLLAVDAEDEAHALTVADYLAHGESAGQFVYEAGRST